MGQNCGFMAVSACIASRDVNICVIPEIHFQIYGKHGVYESIIERAKIKGHCIIVIAEGAFKGLIDDDKKAVFEKMNGGSKIILPWESPDPLKEDEPFVDLASYMKSDLNDYASKHHKVKLSIKYLDPKKAIRACAANSHDVSICHSISNSAAHSAMAGYTDFAVGFVRCQPVMIPY